MLLPHMIETREREKGDRQMTREENIRESFLLSVLISFISAHT